MTQVWMINHFAISPGESGGTRHYSLARELANYGFTPTVIAAASHYQSGKARPMPIGVDAELVAIQGVSFLWLRAPFVGKSALLRLAAMLSFAWEIMTNAPGHHLEKPDIILGSSPDLFTAAASCFLARRLRIPFVLEVRDLWPDSLIELTHHSRFHPIILLMRLLERYVYRRAARIISLLSDAAPYFAGKGANAANVVVIPNGIDVKLLATPIANPPQNKHFTVMYAGAHGIPNQLDTLLQAALLLRDELVDFVLVGDGICKPALQKFVTDHDLQRVTFLSPVPKTEIAALLVQADAFHLEFKDAPLYRFGVSPNKLYDYLLAAKPVLYGANTPSNPVTLANAGVALPPGDAPALADAIRTLMKKSAAEREEMGNRGRAYVLAHHDFVVLGKRLADALRALAS